jgi:DNA-binding CsgD family transcriptional regulator
MKLPSRERRPYVVSLAAAERIEIRKLWRRGMSVWKIAQLLKLEPWQVYSTVVNLKENTQI